MRKTFFCICENKDADQLRGNREADQRLCFRYIEQSLCFLNTKYQASSNLVWSYSPVCVGPGRKPRRRVFSQRGPYCSHSYLITSTRQANCSRLLNLVSYIQLYFLRCKRPIYTSFMSDMIQGRGTSLPYCQSRPILNKLHHYMTAHYMTAVCVFDVCDLNPWSAKPDICRARGVGSLYCFPRSPKNDFNNTEQV